MIEIAENKFRKYDNINFICCDAETYRFNQKYDSIMVFNAFPHFVNPKALIKNLVKAVKSGGTVTVAHDRGRKSLDNHHKSVHASKISNGLMSEDDLEKIFDVEIPEGDYDTISGYLIDLLGRIPKPKENIIIETDQLDFKVEKVKNKKIVQVKVCKK